MLDMKRLRDPLFPQRKVGQTLFGRSAILGIMSMDAALLPSASPAITEEPVPPPAMLPGEPAAPVLLCQMQAILR